MNIQEKIKLFEEWKKSTYYPLVKDNYNQRGEIDDIRDFFIHEKNTSKIPTFLNSTISRIRKMVTVWIDEQNISQRVHEQKDLDYIEILDMDSNFKWIQLISQNSFNNEGLLMDHCVADYFNKDQDQIILSLRNEYNLPKITVEYNPNRNMIIQVRARRNNVISKKYAKYLMELFNYLRSPANQLIKIIDRPFTVRENLFTYHLAILNQNIPSCVEPHHITNEFHKYKPFEVITSSSSLIESIIHYHKRMGLVKSIICNTLTFDHTDYNLLQKISIEAGKIIIRNCPDTIIEQSHNWVCSNFITDNFKSNDFSRDFCGHVHRRIIFPNIEFEPERANLNIIISGRNSKSVLIPFYLQDRARFLSWFDRATPIKTNQHEDIIVFISKKLMFQNPMENISKNDSPDKIIKKMDAACLVNKYAFSTLNNQLHLTDLPGIAKPKLISYQNKFINTEKNLNSFFSKRN